MSAAAELTQLAGWMAHDVGAHRLGQRYLVHALRLAQAAGDAPLGAEILAGMSHQATYLGHGAVGVDLARASARTAKAAGLPALCAEAAVMEAHGYARAGDERRCAASLSEADRIFDQANPADAPQWISYFDKAYLSAKFGHCFRDLGQFKQAETFARRSLDMELGYARGRVFNTLLLASAYAGQGEVEQACSVGRDGLAQTDDMKSIRVAQYVDGLRQQLRPHRQHPTVKQFDAEAGRVMAIQLAS